VGGGKLFKSMATIVLNLTKREFRACVLKQKDGPIHHWYGAEMRETYELEDKPTYWSDTDEYKLIEI
jgi:hypothetical protein